jgi:hypothetical protein
MANRQSPDATGFKAENEIDLVLGNANPNPARAGCPSRDVLTALARRERPIDDPAYDHLIKCSPCYREVRALQQSSAAQASAVRWRMWLAAAAALVVVAIGTALFISSRANRSTGRTEVTSGQRPQEELSAQLDLRKFAVVRGDEKPQDIEPLSLPIGRVNATILLPVGSEIGAYEVQVLDSDLRSRVSTTGAAELREHVTTLQAMLNLTALPLGSYQLAVKRHDENWRMFPLRVVARQ